MSPYEELSQRVDVVVRRHLRCVVVGFDRLNNAVSQYVPSNPPRLHYVTSLTDQQRTVVLVHELTHASLHPPGSEDYDEREYFDHEEPSSHTAAATICARFEVDDYWTLMRDVGLDVDRCGSGDEEIIEVMVERVIGALSSPHTFPEWASAVDRNLWNQAIQVTPECLALLAAKKSRYRGRLTRCA